MNRSARPELAPEEHQLVGRPGKRRGGAGGSGPQRHAQSRDEAVGRVACNGEMGVVGPGWLAGKGEPGGQPACQRRELLVAPAKADPRDPSAAPVREAARVAYFDVERWAGGCSLTDSRFDQGQQGCRRVAEEPDREVPNFRGLPAPAANLAPHGLQQRMQPGAHVIWDGNRDEQPMPATLVIRSWGTCSFSISLK